MADREQNTELKTVADLLNEIEDETLYRALLTVDRRTLQIILLKMQGYSTKEIAPLVELTTGAIYARLVLCQEKVQVKCELFYKAGQIEKRLKFHRNCGKILTFKNRREVSI